MPSVRALKIIEKENGPEELDLTLSRACFKRSEDKDFKVVDMKEELKAGNTSPLSRALKDGLGDIAASHEQALLLVNRRGRFTVVLCRDCGYVLQCSSCNAPLITIEEKDKAATNLLCRYCGTNQASPDLCPSCRSHRFKKLGAGTQRVMDEVKELFPSLSMIRLDGDVVSNIKEQEKILEDFKKGRIQVLIGTQMIVQPTVLVQVSLGAIINIEVPLLLPDYSGDEEVFQTAVAFEELSSKSIIWQTYHPEHRVVGFLKNGEYGRFLKEELATRKKFSWPPFVKLIKLTYYDKDEQRGAQQAEFVYQKLIQARPEQIKLFKPFESRIFKIKNTYSWNILLKIEPGVALKERNRFLSLVPSKWEVDVDPISTL